MTSIAGKVAVVTGAGSGIGRALAYELARRGAKLALSDVDDGRARRDRPARAGHRRARCTSSASTSPTATAVLAYADAVAAEFGVVNIVVNNAGIAFTGDVEQMTLRADRARDGRRLLGRRERHEGVPAAPDRVRRRARRQHLQPVRAAGGAGPERLQRGQVRGARVHRVAAPGDARRRPSGPGHLRAPRRHQDRDRPQRRGGRGHQPGRARRVLRQQAGQDLAESAARTIARGIAGNQPRVLVGSTPRCSTASSASSAPATSGCSASSRTGCARAPNRPTTRPPRTPPRRRHGRRAHHDDLDSALSVRRRRIRRRTRRRLQTAGGGG